MYYGTGNFTIQTRDFHFEAYPAKTRNTWRLRVRDYVLGATKEIEISQGDDSKLPDFGLAARNLALEALSWRPDAARDVPAD